jgi:GNAT superfamily N-acetyltransferase
VASELTSPFVARLHGRIVGCTLPTQSGNQNSPHRAEIAKVIVRRSARRKGIGRALMLAAEARAREHGRWMLVLDTVAGSAADALYRSLGWHETGTVPDYALNTNGQPEAATFFWKHLR